MYHLLSFNLVLVLVKEEVKIVTNLEGSKEVITNREIVLIGFGNAFVLLVMREKENNVVII